MGSLNVRSYLQLNPYFRKGNTWEVRILDNDLLLSFNQKVSCLSGSNQFQYHPGRKQVVQISEDSKLLQPSL